MTLKEYTQSCLNFAEESSKWLDLDRGRFYVATGCGDWAETCDNGEDGIYIDWVWGVRNDPEAIIKRAPKEYLSCFTESYEQSQDECWEAEIVAHLMRKYESCAIVDGKPQLRHAEEYKEDNTL